ncbi:MAG: hypothetical protein ACTHMS_23905 [Jatrophihabitans sp.]|uniref:hypothetical protein n=1 Tax=Jatrophihabitans sp. TaxID=1932789 RepID=UPI003F7DB471
MAVRGQQWTDGVFRGREPADGPPAATGARLREWRADELARAARLARRPEFAEGAIPVSGIWWSAPIGIGPRTTGLAVEGGPIGLVLVEDWPGWEFARLWPVVAAPSARVLEIDSPADWTALVDRHPLDVTGSRRFDWNRRTGRAGPWLIPDYAAVAADWDAIHLTVAGYLTTADRPLPVRGGSTLLAGWSPDETAWLTDVLTVAGPPVLWREVDGEWRPGARPPVPGPPGERP